MTAPTRESIRLADAGWLPLRMDEVRVDPSVALRIPSAVAVRREMLPFLSWQGRVHVACADVSDVTGLALVQRNFDQALEPVPAEPESLRRVVASIHGNGRGSPQGVGRLGAKDPNEGAEASAAAGLSEELVREALLRQASDLHVDPGPGDVRVRVRVDGVLEELRRVPTAMAASLVSRFKVLAQMDIAEKRAPQDGAYRHALGEGRAVDIRAATLPTRWGERLTLRLLGREGPALDLEGLGMDGEHLATFETALSRPHGMILLTGPTGSGKSTTLHAGVRRLLRREPLNVITVEDPVEQELEGAAQVTVDAADKTSFAKALRSILRHDPDVVMIGEVRDPETAGIAVKASLTGHLVLSSLHTNTAAGAVTRLSDMGVERYLVASTLRLSVAQRLVRRLCGKCRAPGVMTEDEAAGLGRGDAAGKPCWKATGCWYCAGRGAAGRLALFEMLPVDDTWSRVVNGGAHEAELVEEMRRRGHGLLLDDGMAKLARGETSLDEVRAAVMWG
ncbi:MAG: GspE/PulE family protein [Verrucomicrobiota bacterium]